MCFIIPQCKRLWYTYKWIHHLCAGELFFFFSLLNATQQTKHTGKKQPKYTREMCFGHYGFLFFVHYNTLALYNTRNYLISFFFVYCLCLISYETPVFFFAHLLSTYLYAIIPFYSSIYLHIIFFFLFFHHWNFYHCIIVPLVQLIFFFSRIARFSYLLDFILHTFKKYNANELRRKKKRNKSLNLEVRWRE